MRPYAMALTTLMITHLSLSLALAQSFKVEQLRYPRVTLAFTEKEPLLSAIFAQQQLPYPPKRIFIRIFKREGTMELWASPASCAAFHLVKAYPICASSGSFTVAIHSHCLDANLARSRGSPDDGALDDARAQSIPRYPQTPRRASSRVLSVQRGSVRSPDMP